MTTDFLELRLVGDRFEAHTVPFEVLRDFVGLEDLLVELARRIHLKGHPERQRAARGLREHFQIGLAQVTPGSARLKIVRLRPDELALADVFDQAKSVALAAMCAVFLNQPTPPDFPTDLFPLFERFGKSLKADEGVEFPAEDARPAFTYDQKLRRHLILRSGKKSYTEPVEIRGGIIEINDQAATFTLREPDGKTHKSISYEAHWRDKVIKAMKERAFTRVLLQATGVYDGSEQLTRIQEPTSLDLLESNDVNMRIDELLVLEDGWLGGVGSALSRDGLEWLRKQFTDHWPDEVPIPFLYPTPEGGIRTEWSSIEWEISAEIDIAIKQAEFVSIPLVEGEIDEAVISLATPADWKTAAQWVAKFAPMNPEAVGGIT